MRRRHSVIDTLSPVTMFALIAGVLLVLLALMELAADFGKL